MKARRKIAYASVAVAGAWLVVEALTFLMLSVVESTPATPALFDGRRAHEMKGGEAVEDVETQTAGKQVLHPYLGFVRNPERPGEHHVSRLGFHRTHSKLSATGGDDEECTEPGATRVGVFGGSVALLFSQLGTERLFREMEGVWSKPCLRSFALAGYKQPQQLSALAYLESLGEDVDVVINLDGFNEVALPYAENAPLGVFYAYPRSWSVLAQSTLDPEEQNLRGEVLFLRKRRQDRAAFFSRKPFSYSALWNLLWRFQDERLAASIAELEAAHRERLGGENRYATHGPTKTFADDDAFFAELAALWERSSLAMHQLCAARGVRYYHVLQPNQYVAGSKVFTAEEKRSAIKADSPYKAAVERGYPYLREAGKRLTAAGVRFYDLTDVFGNVTETVYVDSCCHFDAHGAELIAVELAKRIRADGDGDGAH